VQLLPRLTDAFDQSVFDHHVNVFQRFVEDEVAGFDVALDRAQPLDDLVSFRSVIRPTFASIVAWRDAPAMSCLYSRLS
jgi:hypothetical protein